MSRVGPKGPRAKLVLITSGTWPGNVHRLSKLGKLIKADQC